MSTAIIQPTPTQNKNALASAEINAEHAKAQGCAKEAIKHAIRCGELLEKMKFELPHGRFMPWLKANCKFEYSTAARYMKAAEQSSTGVEISSLSSIFPSGRPDSKKRDTTVAPPVPIAAPAASASGVFSPAPIKTAMTRQERLEADKTFLPGGVVHNALFGQQPDLKTGRITPALPAPTSSSPTPSSRSTTANLVIENLEPLVNFCRSHTPEEAADAANPHEVSELIPIVDSANILLGNWILKFRARLVRRNPAFAKAETERLFAKPTAKVARRKPTPKPNTTRANSAAEDKHFNKVAADMNKALARISLNG